MSCWKRLDTNPPLNLRVEVTCKSCPTTGAYLVNRNRYAAWENRETLIQDAFPHLAPADREFIKSVQCPECWDKMLGLNFADE